MRRIKLIWFALGAATSAILSIVAAWLLQPGLSFDHNWTPYVVLTEQVHDTDKSDLALVANRTGELLRNCGARVFETTFLYNDHAPTADYPIIEENFESLECVLNQVEDTGIHFEIEIRQPPRAADELRTAQ